MNLKEISSIDWFKKWASPFTLLMACDLAEHYEVCEKMLGVPYIHVLFVSRKGVLTTYLSKEEHKRFSLYGKEKIEHEKGYAEGLFKKIKERTDELNKKVEKLLEKPIAFDEYFELKEDFRAYTPYYLIIIRTADYLSSEASEKYFKELEDTRLYGEQLYRRIDDYFIMVTEHIAENTDLDKKLALNLLHSEIVEYVESEVLPPKNVLLQRSVGVGLYYDFDGDIQQVLSVDDADEVESAIFQKEGLVKGQAKGDVAYSGGIVEGVVRIVHDPRNYDVFEEGDILVTGMTRPEFLPLMKKAGAIVTDAGGLLCHAAIVSRELKKPCIIGTRTASKAFEDGDTVEVNTKEAIVKKV